MAGDFDVAVIGAGVIGSSAALAAARKGKRVVVLEQHALGHRKGSSHGCSRIIRRTYPNEHYTAMMTRAYDAWDAVTAEAGEAEPLVQRKGGLDLMPAGSPLGKTLLDAAAKEGLATEELGPAETEARFGVRVPETYRCVYQADTGVLNADRCCAAIRAACEGLGVAFRAGARVQAVRRRSDGSTGLEVALAAPDGEVVRAGHVIACPGREVASFLSSCLGVASPPPLTPVRVHVHYVARSADGGPDPPVVIDYADWLPGVDGEDGAALPVYMMPANAHAGAFKVACHIGYPADDVVPPEREFDDRIRGWIGARVPGLEASAGALASDSCWYTVSPDEDFVLDDITGRVLDGDATRGRVVLGAGFSGHGFKMAPVVGEMLARLALGEEPEAGDVPLLAMFRFGRFAAAESPSE